MIKKGKFGKFLALICSLMAGVMIFSLAACNDDGGETNSLKLNKDTLSVAVGGTEQLSVTSSTTENIEWTIDKTSVATVKGSGAGNKLCTVTGVAEGTATVTAKAGDQTATCAVTVGGTSQGDETVTIKLGGEAVGTDAYNLYGEGDALTFTATASKGSAITWESSDPAKATVSNGKVTAVAAGDATITAKVNNDVKASVNVKVLEGTTVNKGEEGSFASGWVYYAGESDASVSACESFGADGVKIKYTWSGGLFWNVQLFYKDKYCETDHGVTLTVVAPQAGKITVNGVAQELNAGENSVAVEHYSNKSTLSIQFGVEGDSCFTGTDLEFMIKDIVYTNYAEVELKAPAFTFDTNTQVVNINDTVNTAENVEKYELGVFASETAEMPAQTYVVVDGTAVNFVKVSTGTYYLKVRAVNTTEENGSKIINSAWSTDSVTFNWVNDKTLLTFKAKDDIAANSQTWHFWHQNWDPVCHYDVVYMDGNTIHVLGVSNNVGDTWSFQLFYKGDSNKKFNITVTAVNAGDITVNGTTKSLTADTAQKFENVNAGEISIQFGGSNVANNLQGDVTLLIEEVTA